jgi:hypothetical protein
MRRLARVRAISTVIKEGGLTVIEAFDMAKSLWFRYEFVIASNVQSYEIIFIGHYLLKIKVQLTLFNFFCIFDTLLAFIVVP